LKKAIQFGAGNIGRGFLGELFHRAGYKIIFVEKDEKLVEEINQKGGYTLEIVGPRRFERYEIDKIMAIIASDQARINREMARADIMAISVGRAALPQVVSILAEGLKARCRARSRVLNIIIAENVLKGEELLYQMLAKNMDKEYKLYLDEKVGLVQAVVSRMVPVLSQEIKEKDPLYIKAEEYGELPVDKKAFKGDIPAIEGLKPYEHFAAYEERKIFIHNTGHALVAYLGFLKGYEFIYEAMGDSWIRDKVRMALKEIGQALVKKYPFLSLGLEDHLEDLLQRFSNQALADTIKRVARDPLRKLKPEERLVGACRLIEKYGGDPARVSLGISAGLLYEEESDESSQGLQNLLRQKGMAGVLQEICGLEPQENLYRLVEQGLKELGEIRK
jgi:mannitol-1-phosphate 5-dehydrogenase